MAGQRRRRDPDGLIGRDYYEPRRHGAERALVERLLRLRRIIRGEQR